MITVQDIKQALARLPKPELDRFRSWFEEFDAEAWDRQFEEDAESGKLDRLAGQALTDLKEGRCKEL
jgi:hypothetical protein